MASAGSRKAQATRRRKRRMARVEHDHSAAQWNALKAAWGGWPTAARPTGHCSATVEVLEGAATVPTTIAVSDGPPTRW
ncbi:MAG: hypothetical protein ACRDX9_05090 [Acidimicrobiia bacterium]